MEKKKEIGSAFTIGELTLIPVIDSYFSSGSRRGSTDAFYMKQPVSVVVISPETKKVLRITGEEVSLDEYLEEVPEIRESLEAF